jgi:hypothetical protein
MAHAASAYFTLCLIYSLGGYLSIYRIVYSKGPLVGIDGGYCLMVLGLGLDTGLLLDKRGWKWK